MGSSILGPRILSMAGVCRFFLPIANGGEAIGGNAEREKIPLRAIRSSLSKSDVILRRSTLIAMTFDLDLNIGIFLQQGRILLQNLCVLGTDVIFVEIETNVFEETALKDGSFDP